MATIEIRLRTFFTCDEGQITPSTTVTIDSGEIGNVPWSATVEKLFKQMCGEMDGGPFTNLREMNATEVEDYLAFEKSEERLCDAGG